jgi:hypothetical protein
MFSIRNPVSSFLTPASVLPFLVIVAGAAPCFEAAEAAAISHGRVGLHGMVVFGNGSKYFIEHIPMLHPPHDYQVVAEVRFFVRGQSVRENFSNATFTLKPSANFSLDEFISGELIGFKGSIYSGSFEQDGKVLSGLENVEVEVVAVLFTRQLPGESNVPFFEVDDGENTYRTNAITPRRSDQRIENRRTGEELWCVLAPEFFQFCP